MIICGQCRRPRNADKPCRGCAPGAASLRVAALEEYRYVDMIDSGGFGAVYGCEDAQGAQWALKLIDLRSARTASAEDARRSYEREAEALTRLRNRHVVRCVAHGAVDGELLFLLLEHVPTTLQKVLDPRRPMALPRATQLAVELIDALAYLHSEKVYHRDVTPGNIGLDAGDRVRLLDLGIAKLHGPKWKPRQSTMAGFGKPFYAPPEQILHGRTGPFSDIYAFGAVVYQMVAGHHHLPANLQGTEPAHLQAFYRQSLVPLPPDPERPDTLDFLLAKCLEPDPNQRARNAHWVQAQVIRIAEWVQTGHGRIDEKYEAQAKAVAELQERREALAREVADLQASSKTLQLEQRALDEKVGALRKQAATRAAEAGEVTSLKGRVTQLWAEAEASRQELETLAVEIKQQRTVAAAARAAAKQAKVARDRAGASSVWLQWRRRPVAVAWGLALVVGLGVGAWLTHSWHERARRTPARLGRAVADAPHPPTRVSDAAVPADQGASPPLDNLVNSVNLVASRLPGNESRPALVRIPAGLFQMGSPDGKGGRDEHPRHWVRISRSLWFAETEVTQGQFQALMKKNPSYFTDCGAKCPVESVSWFDAVAYCNKLSSQEGLEPCYALSGRKGDPAGGCKRGKASCEDDHTIKKVDLKSPGCSGYRLPTEAEWEYACRAGTETRYGSGNTDKDLARVGWYDANSDGKTHPVGSKTLPLDKRSEARHPWGLLDMHGNVWEWCNDWSTRRYEPAEKDNPIVDPEGPSGGDWRVVRGGSFGNGADWARSAFRDWWYPQNRLRNRGFRVVRPVVPEPG